jgi:predicted transcriptional regulator
MGNRSEIEILAAILNAGVSNWEYKTTIMYNTGISYPKLNHSLTIAIKNKMMEHSATTGLYRTTEVGIIFLKKFEQLQQLFPTIMKLPDIAKNDSVVNECMSNQE